MPDPMLNHGDIIADSPTRLDLADPDQQDTILALADRLISRLPGADDLLALETSWCVAGSDIPLIAHLAIKLARSRILLQSVPKPLHLSLIFAVYKEHTRILLRHQHPHGEDFLRRKTAQLSWLFRDIPDADWDLSVVDDGCPQGSGRLAQEIITDASLSDRVRVLMLEDAISAGHPATIPLESVEQSRKGGSIVYGLWEAAAIRRDGHLIAYTDADLSTHLGLLGLLIDPVRRKGAAAAIGSRREPLSIVIKTGTRNTRGKLFIYLWKRLFPELHHLVDTQCGFKAFSADTIRAIGTDVLERQFAFDIELLLKTRLLDQGDIVKVPVAWIDSEAASTTTDLQPYLPMLRKMVLMYRKYLPVREESDRFAKLIEALDEITWARLVDDVPAGIAEREPYQFGDWNGIDVDELGARAGLTSPLQAD